ncbi:hypothetical protein DFP72DRAFT_1168702 [Ephemerocybe angulata]|uniref:DUF6533 domain-containing protein n=1 Tax=Ephemerocybe angulata TaxID=980116 RepID=A0A8H6I306_9AGAR|nr:hypothetical protein DFP72DRAFT_1168702 [Tulosesus angulatus]
MPREDPFPIPMSSSAEEVAELAFFISQSAKREYLSCRLTKVAFYTLYCYYFLTTVDEEASTMWKQKLRTGKILYLILRYAPILFITMTVLVGFRVHTTISLKSCEGLWITADVLARLIVVASEVVVLLCLYALLGAKRRYLTILMALYLGLTVGGVAPQIKYLSAVSTALPNPELFRELGYACNMSEELSSEAVRGLIIAGYIVFSKGAAMAVLAIVVFYARYRSRASSLLHVIRRDGGIYIISLTVIRLGGAIITAFQLKLGTSNIPIQVIAGIRQLAAPIFAYRLLLNMRRTEDPGIRSVVSSILFDPPKISTQSESFTVEDSSDPTSPQMEMGKYAGLGRRRNAEMPEENVEVGTETKRVLVKNECV